MKSLGITDGTKADFDNLKALVEKRQSEGLPAPVEMSQDAFLQVLMVTYRAQALGRLESRGKAK
jgi:hypothetical protein